MILDFNPHNGMFLLRVPRGAPVAEIMAEHGLDFSTPDSTEHEAVLFTGEEYAAASFGRFATPAARAKLGRILVQVEASWVEDHAGHFDVPDDKKLWPFQRASIAYALNRKHSLVGDEPGLGKTPIAIVIANEMRAKRVLVVCPASIRYQWERRIVEWSTMNRSYRVPNGFVYRIMSSSLGVHRDAAWTVISWDLVRSPFLRRALLEGKFDLMILDEVHYAKTPSSGRTRAVFGNRAMPDPDGLAPLLDASERCVALTGTPLPNRPREAYTLLRGLAWDAIDWASERAFNERFNPIRREKTDDGRFYLDERVGRQGELQNRLRANLMVRHLKRDVMKQLQLPVYDLIQLEETAAVRAALQAEKLLDIDPESLKGKDAAVLGEIATVRRLMGVAMAPQITTYLDMLLNGGDDKLVVFAWHIEVLDILQRALVKAEWNPIRIDGSDSGRSKDDKVRLFIREPKHHILIGNMLSMGTGTDGLQEVSTHGLIAEPDWVFGNNVQAFDRLDRGGQRGQVQGDIFVVPGSIAERVLASALRKAAVIHKAMDRRVA